MRDQPTTKQTTLVIADDHPVFCKGLKDIIETRSEFHILGEAENGEIALNLISESKPDIAVIDIEMPVMDGFQLVGALHSSNIPTEIIFLTMHKEEDVFNEAMNLGVRGFILKESAVREIVECLQVVASGKYYVSPVLSTYLMSRSQRTNGFHYKNPSMLLLTPTEKKILRLIGENKTSKQIAEELFISHKTVENHRANISNKLELHGSHHLLKFAIENKSYL